jgi:hypothetical protein
VKHREFVGHYYFDARKSFLEEAKNIFREFLIDELGEDFYDQLRYEAACTALKDLKRRIEKTKGYKEQKQLNTFYIEKLEELKGKSSQFKATPYTV